MRSALWDDGTRNKHGGIAEEHHDGGVAVAGAGDDEGLQPDEKLVWRDAEAQVECPQRAGEGVAVREHPGHLTDGDVEGEEFIEQTERRGRRACRRRGCRDVGRQVAHAALDLRDDVRPAGVLAARGGTTEKGMMKRSRKAWGNVWKRRGKLEVFEVRRGTDGVEKNLVQVHRFLVAPHREPLGTLLVVAVHQRQTNPPTHAPSKAVTHKEHKKPGACDRLCDSRKGEKGGKYEGHKRNTSNRRREHYCHVLHVFAEADSARQPCLSRSG